MPSVRFHRGDGTVTSTYRISSSEMLEFIEEVVSTISWEDLCVDYHWLEVPERIRRMTVPNIEQVQRIWQLRMVYPIFTGHSFSIGRSKK